MLARLTYRCSRAVRPSQRATDYPSVVDLPELLKLAKEYGLALRVVGRSWIDRVQRQGLPSNGHDFLDSYLLDPVDKSVRFSQQLREVPAGLSEWAVHPGLDNDV